MPDLPNQQSRQLNQYFLEPLEPLVRLGYKSIAARALKLLTAWYNGLGSPLQGYIDKKLASLNLPDSKPTPMIYVASGGSIQQRTLSSASLLEDTVSSATKQLEALASDGNIAVTNPESFARLFFSLDYGITKQTPTADQIVALAFGIAVSYYRDNGGRHFADQLAALAKLGGIRIMTHHVPKQQEPVYTEDGEIVALNFALPSHMPATLNLITALRLIYVAAFSVLVQDSDGSRRSEGLSELRRKIIAASAGRDFPSGHSGGLDAYLADDSAIEGIAELLDKVSIHQGVEAMISRCKVPQPELKETFGLAKVLDTVRTGKIALGNNDTPYSDAIGLAEMIG